VHVKKLTQLFFLFLAFSCVACAQSALPLPWVEQPFFVNNGAIAANGFVYTYQSGTLINQATYTDATAATQNSNPILLNGDGFPTCSGTQCGIWGIPSTTYRICLQNSAHVQQYCIDGVQVPGANSNTLNYQKSSTPLTGSSSDQTMFTYTLPAGTLTAGQGVRVTIGAIHSTGSASVAYKISIGGSVDALLSSSTTTELVSTVLFVNDPASQTSNAIEAATVNAALSGGNYLSTSINTTNSVVITATFNVANTDQVTPHFFLVELIH
jgi:hypothetical protein